MTRTQIQLPDELYQKARTLADRQEISLAELVRRGLEYMVSVSPANAGEVVAWELPPATRLGGADPFADPSWRERLHLDRHLAAAAPHGHSGAPKGGQT